ncbi:MAG: hypothetical protein K2X82_20150 [Gemmataceae bacterium]|nr:hypothetical protein [Gemmataceae bacterium]
MRSVRLLLTAALLAPAVGCTWLKNQTGGLRPAAGNLDEVESVRLVNYLNTQAGHLRSLEYDDIRVHVSGRDVPIPANLSGSLVAAQPRNFRMVGKPMVAGGKVDLGSNDDQFWIYVQIMSDPAFYRYATHADFQSGRAPLPGNVPFDPEWVMQALGMTTLPATNDYTVRKDGKDGGTYTLSWPAAGPGGTRVTKEVVFDAQAATGARPQVRRHLIRDGRNKVVASAEVKTAQSTVVVVKAVQPGGIDRVTVQYPTRVVLRWEEQEFEMDLDLKRAQVNQFTPDNPARRDEFARLFTRPDDLYRNANPIDLAGGFAPAR